MSRPTPSPEQIDRFLELYASGVKPDEAARALNDPERTEPELRSDDAYFTASVFNALSKRDEDFKRRFDEATGEHYENFEERIRSMYVSRAASGSDRLLDNLGQAVLPELAPLRQRSVAHDIKVQIGRYFDLTQLGRFKCIECGHEHDELDLLTMLVEKASKPKGELPAAGQTT